MQAILVTAALILYLAGAALLGRRLAHGYRASQESRLLPLAAGAAAVVLHSLLLYEATATPEALNLSFFNMLSMVGWLTALLILLSALGQPVENLAIAVFPFAAAVLLMQELVPANPTLLPRTSAELETHVLLSVLSYSLLAVAAIQALLLAIQNRHLRNRHPGGFIRALPPLETMESLLFRLIGVGYLLLTLSLLSGAAFVEDIFAQHLVHKTVLSIVAWFVFAVLLWGRMQFGWRGRTAVRWTIGGFVVLVIAYFGSKMVLELILR